MRKRYYIMFVSRQEDGELKRIPVPMHYAYVFVAAAVVGVFTITGMAGSYTRMMLKAERFNQVRQEREALRKNYHKMEQLVREKDVQAASLGSLANEVSALYGLRQTRMGAPAPAAPASSAPLENSDDLSQQQYTRSLDAFYSLRARALTGGLVPAPGMNMRLSRNGDDWIVASEAPSLWPVEGTVTSSFGQRLDPFNGEGAFHAGIDIAAPSGVVVRATADGLVTRASVGNGYGREVVLDHGHGISTIYGHMSGFAVMEGEQVRRGQVIGFVGSTGRSTGPHVHYEVRIHDVAVNPHKYLRLTNQQFAANSEALGLGPLPAPTRVGN